MEHAQNPDIGRVGSRVDDGCQLNTASWEQVGHPVMFSKLPRVLWLDMVGKLAVLAKWKLCKRDLAQGFGLRPISPMMKLTVQQVLFGELLQFAELEGTISIIAHIQLSLRGGKRGS